MTSSQPFRLTISVYPADRNQFAVSVGQVPDDVKGHRASSPECARRHEPPGVLAVRQIARIFTWPAQQGSRTRRS